MGGIVGIVTGLLPFIRGLGLPGLGEAKSQGFDAVKAMVKNLTGQARDKVRDDVVDEALERMVDDGDDKLLLEGSGYSWVDKDGVMMNAKQKFVHQGLFAIFRTKVGGGLADLPRDDNYTAWGHSEAETLLSGVTDARQGLVKIFDRWVEQL